MRYIPLNPVRAGIVTDLVDCQWSSHRYGGYGIGTGLTGVYGSIRWASDRRFELLSEKPVRGPETDGLDVTLSGSTSSQHQATAESDSIERVADRVA